MKISLKPLLLSLGASLALALTASAQGSSPTSSGMTVTSASGADYGLLGQSYMGVNFGYTTIDDGPPDVSRSYGFIANRPTEFAGVDAMFRYTYSNASAFGVKAEMQEFMVGGTGYVSLGRVKPFAEANVGWGFLSGGGSSLNSFAFRIGAGVEIQLAPRVVLSPYVNYEDLTRLSGSSTFNSGVRVAVRIVKEFSATAAIEVDDDQNVTYRLGINRHF